MHQALSTCINSCTLHNNLLRWRLLLIIYPDGETEELKDQVTFPNAETEMPINSRASSATLHCAAWHYPVGQIPVNALLGTENKWASVNSLAETFMQLMKLMVPRLPLEMGSRLLPCHSTAPGELCVESEYSILEKRYKFHQRYPSPTWNKLDLCTGGVTQALTPPFSSNKSLFYWVLGTLIHLGTR